MGIMSSCCIGKVSDFSSRLLSGQASEQTIMAIAGHLSRAMLEHYSHIPMAAKRVALEGTANQTEATAFEAVVNQNVHQPAVANSVAPSNSLN
jgi:hypothetical protein